MVHNPCQTNIIPILNPSNFIKYLHKQPIATLYPDIIVSPIVKKIIEDNKLTGVNFRHNVKDYL